METETPEEEVAAPAAEAAEEVAAEPAPEAEETDEEVAA